MRRTVTDVVVIGGGGAGLMTALSAARLGRSVVLLEKNPKLGGTSGMSVGSISASATRQQRAAGIEDTPDAHFEDMPKFHGSRLANRDNPALRRILVDSMPETMRFLSDLGLVFMNPVPEPPHRVPRLHQVLPHSGAYIYLLSKACRKEGVDIRTSSPARRIVMEAGRAIGVEIDGPVGPELISARRGVVLASGDISAAPEEYRSRHLPPEMSGIAAINTTSTGDGQKMGEAVGGSVVNGDIAWGPEIRFVAPPTASFITRLPPVTGFARLVKAMMGLLPQSVLRPFLMSFVTTYLAPSHGLFREGGILVNKRGERFCNEQDQPHYAMTQQPDHVAYILLDSATAAKFTDWPHFVSTAPGVAYAYLPDYERNRRDICFKADTLDGLAAKIGVPAEALKQSVETYNAGERGERPALGAGPYVALGPAKPWIVFTEGGLTINEDMQVVDKSQTPIPGLYAAGSAGQGGLLLEGHGHHLGWAFASGRIAGRNAAFNAIADSQ
ncbi:MAG: FAD-dependent oxidoreductase [Alphaproteobacteria bacterium]|nr:FAD-dependent oxidoreductase [Alphaproteobacteria bacterium]